VRAICARLPGDKRPWRAKRARDHFVNKKPAQVRLPALRKTRSQDAGECW
jgi:hypothetical protein